MRDLILNKIKELEEEKKTYYEILENSKLFSESYIIGRIRSARDKIDVLNEILEEVDENVWITDKTILWTRLGGYMKVGDYVRTKDGRISKIASIDSNSLYSLEDYNYKYKQDWLVKSSPNIIDLIEVGDYVNGKKVIDKWEEPDWYGYFIKLEGEETVPTIRKIKSIVTKEQFSQMEYRIEE